MKQTKRSGKTWLGTILIIFTSLVSFSVQAQEGEFTETFDDPALPGWEHSTNVEIVDGILRVGTDGYAVHDSVWVDFNLRLFSRRMGDGFVIVSYRFTDMGEYSIHISGEQVTLIKTGEMIAQENLEFIPPEEWFYLEIVVVGESHEILLNGQPVLKAADPDGLPPGHIGLGYQGGVRSAEFDNLNINLLGDEITDEEPIDDYTEPVVPVKPTADPTEVSIPEEPAPEPTQQSSVTGEGVPAYQRQPWVVLGGPPGGLGYDIRMAPENPDIMYVTDSGAGIFKSTNGGRSWFPVNQGIESSPDIGTRVFTVTIDPHDSDTIWIGTQLSGHIYHSTDGGQSWERRDNGIIPSTSGEHSVRGITVDPYNPNLVYAAFEDTETKFGISHSSGEVYKSSDAGLNWTRIWQGDNLARYIWVDPSNPQRLFVSTGIFDRKAANSGPRASDTGGGVGILRSEDQGETWTVLDEDNGLDGGLYVPSLFMHPENPNVLIAAISAHGGRGTKPGVYLTEDFGDSWNLILQAAEETGAEVSMEAVEISTADPDVWYAAASEVVYRSDDRGKTWQQFPLRTADRGSGFPIDIQVDPRDPYRLFINGYGGGNMMSTDGGETWVDASMGYSGAGIWGLFAEPNDGWTVTVAANTANFYSSNGGQTWKGLEIPSPEGDPRRSLRGRIISFPEGSGIHIIGSGDFNIGYVYHSKDGGYTWEASRVVDIQEMLEKGQIDDSIYAARALTQAPSDSRIVYIGYAGRFCILGSYVECRNRPPGFFRSIDGGYNWENVRGTPFDGDSIFTLAVSLDDPYKVFAATMGGVFFSEDGGDSWQRLKSLETIAPKSPEMRMPPIFVIATDPFDSRLVYAGSPRGGMYLSRDSGESWEPAGLGMDPNEAINDILPDPDRPGVIYASTRESGVFYTTNWGQSWLHLNDGISKMWVDQMALADGGSVLYAGTHVAGLLRLGTPAGIPPEIPVTAWDVTETPEIEKKPEQESTPQQVGEKQVEGDLSEMEDENNILDESSTAEEDSKPIDWIVIIVVGNVLLLVVVILVVIFIKRRGRK